tara:strand:+ start:254 stop:472 length:219 start_codon:yes stop_codon:yes gene_type:complete
MKASEMISELTAAIDLYGDLPVSTFDGDISSMLVTPLKDGSSIPSGDLPDTFSIEFFTSLEDDQPRDTDRAQ